MATDLTKFNAVRVEISKYKEKNENLVFDYRDPQGNKEARSHIFRLRKTKTMITDIHKEVKAEALAACQAIDAEKRFLIGEVEEMIEIHATPIKAIEEEKEREALAQFQARAAEKQAEEERKQKEMEEREAEVARKEAEIKVKEDAIKAEQEKVRLEAERVEYEKRIAEEAAAKARAEAEAKAKVEENARIAKEAAEKAEKERLAEIERKRVEDKTYRELVYARIQDGLNAIIKDHKITEKVVITIREGKIEHLAIKY